jgi:N-formylglutamate deformylase
MASESVFKLIRGNSPLLVSMPHVGTELPDWLLPRLTSEALALPDTDWYLDLLYDFLEAIGATVLIATHSRYVIDLNRPPDDSVLYPSLNSTSLCPNSTFSAKSLYKKGFELTGEERLVRIENYWQPYHNALKEEILRIKSLHGRAMLWDAHSIRSFVPRFFKGKLSNLNLGTSDNQSCAPSLTRALESVLIKHPQYSYTINGRFKGGYITRHYGQPDNQIHAVQLELAMRTYMNEEAPYQFNKQLSQVLRPVLLELMITMQTWQENLLST